MRRRLARAAKEARVDQVTAEMLAALDEIARLAATVRRQIDEVNRHEH